MNQTLNKIRTIIIHFVLLLLLFCMHILLVIIIQHFVNYLKVGFLFEFKFFYHHQRTMYSLNKIWKWSNWDVLVSARRAAKFWLKFGYSQSGNRPRVTFFKMGQFTNKTESLAFIGLCNHLCLLVTSYGLLLSAVAGVIEIISSCFLALDTLWG